MTDQEDDAPPSQPAELTVPPVEPAPPPAPPVPPPYGSPGDGWVRPRRVQRPVLGATLWCFGALFWSYLVVGEIVVWTAVPEAFGVLAVLATFGIAWYRATSQMPPAPRRHWLLPGILAFFSWLVALVISMIVFATDGRKQAELAALMLWSVAAGTYTLGRHLTAQEHVPLTANARKGRIALWLIAGIATLMAGVNIISYA
jgi:hypothetical protein